MVGQRCAVTAAAFFQTLYQAFDRCRHTVDTECLIQGGVQGIVAAERIADQLPIAFARLDPAVVYCVAVSEYFVRRTLVFAVSKGCAGAIEAFDREVVVAFVGAHIQDVADAVVRRRHDLQAAEQDFRLLAVGFVDIEVEPIPRLGIGQGRKLGFVFFKLACGNFFRAFLITRVGQRILLAETQSKCLSRGKAESEKGKTAA